MKKLIIGLVIGLMLGISTNAFAAIGDSVTAVFASFNYVVNGESKILDSPVLVYEGTSYVRTTQVSNMLGYDVVYRADSRTIEFIKPETIQPAPLTQGSLDTSVTVQTYGATPEPSVGPTPIPSATPEPVTGIAPTPAPSSEPIATPAPTPDPYNGQSNEKFLRCHPLLPGSMEYIINDCG